MRKSKIVATESERESKRERERSRVAEEEWYRARPVCVYALFPSNIIYQQHRSSSHLAFTLHFNQAVDLIIGYFLFGAPFPCVHSLSVSVTHSLNISLAALIILLSLPSFDYCYCYTLSHSLTHSLNVCACRPIIVLSADWCATRNVYAKLHIIFGCWLQSLEM